MEGAPGPLPDQCGKRHLLRLQLTSSDGRVSAQLPVGTAVSCC